MANTERRMPDKDGKMFVPVSVDGDNVDESFIDSGKLIIIVAIVIIFGIAILYVYNSMVLSIGIKLLYTLVIVSVALWVVRIFIIKEGYYLKVYRELKEYEVCTPALFWNVVGISADNDGYALLTYSDLKVAIMVRVERDTITGKDEEFTETHYDAISDFYKEINLAGLKVIQMNIMEIAGKDSRLTKLDELIHKAPNKNISTLMELQINYIKNISRATLYESDYYLVYANDAMQIRNLVSNTIEAFNQLLNGAFITFNVLSKEEIIDFIKEMYGVRLFDPSEAAVNIFKQNMGGASNMPFILKSVIYTDGRIEKCIKNKDETRRSDGVRYAKSNVGANSYKQSNIKSGKNNSIKKGHNGIIDKVDEKFGLMWYEGDQLEGAAVADDVVYEETNSKVIDMSRYKEESIISDDDVIDIW